MLISKDSFALQSALDSLKKTLIQVPATQAVLETPSQEKIAQELNTLSLFANRHLVIVQGIEKLSKPTTEYLISYFSNPSTTVFLILTASSLARNTKLYKEAEKHGIMLDIAELKPWEKEKVLQQWIVETVAAQGKNITAQVAHYLIKHVTNDQTQLNLEIEKLMCYTIDRKEITLQDVIAITSAINLENVWQLGEAIFQRDANSALRISKALLNDGVAFLALLRQVRNQLQTQLQVCCILANGGNQQQITEHFPYMRGKILEKHVQQAQNYGKQKCISAMIKVDDVEMLAKSSGASPDLLADMLITQVIR